MATNESTYVLRVQAEIGDLSAKVAQAKASLDGLLKSGQAPKGLIQSFQQVETLLGRIQDASKAPPSKAMFSAMQKDVGKLGASFSGLIRNIDDLRGADSSVKMELIPDGEKEKLQALMKVMSQYEATLKDIETQEKAVAKAKKDSEAASKTSKRAKEDKVSKKNKLDVATGKRDAAQTKLAALDPNSEKDAKQIATLSAQITKLDAEIVALNRDYRQASATLTEANKAAKVAGQAYTDMSASLEAMKSSKLEELSSAARQAGVSFESIDGATVSDELARLSTAMDSFKTETEDVGTVIDEANSNLGETPEKVKEVANSVEHASTEWSEYNEQQNKLKGAQERIKQFLGITGAVKLMTKAFRQAFNATKELDAAMQEIAVVTDFEISDMWDQMPQYAKRANELGISITQAYKASALFYQQGLDTNEVVALSNETLKMARIANLDAAEATDRMTAALRGFNMELNQTSAQQVADVYSKLAAITASDVDEISSAMTKTASIASSAGMEFETTAAFLSQIIETTRESAETAGTALKTVIARFQELKKDPADIGEVDGESIDANQIETALRSVGVSLRDASGQFRELDDVFMELSSKWDGLDKNTQRYIATIAAGSRQQSRFIAMMQDYSRTQELVTAANTSAGASAKQYEKTLESLETKLTKLENAWTEFSTGLLNNEAIKFGVDMITSFIEAINKATSSTEGWMGTISKIGVILALFRVATALFKQFQVKLMNFFTQTGTGIVNNVIAGMKSKEGELVSEAGKIAKKASDAASNISTAPKKEASATGSKSSTTTTPPPTTTTQTGEVGEQSSGGKFKKVAGTAAKIAFAPQIGAYKAAKAVGAKNKEIARGIVSKSKLGGEAIESQEKAAVAEGFATDTTQQITQANTAISGTAVGTDLAGLQGLGNDINALALPLDSIEQQFLEKMESMGVSTEEAKKEWQELMGEISNGESTAGQAVDKINSRLQEVADFSVGVDSDMGRLQVTDEMQTEAANRFAVASDDNPANMVGLSAIAGNVGGDMANTLAYNPEAQGMSASALPMEQIEMQFKEKMTNMGVSTDEVEQKWKELYDTIENGGGTAVDALEAINNELEETANQADQAGSNVDSSMRRIKNTSGTSSAASERLEDQTAAQAKLTEQQNKAAQTQQENEQKAEESQQKMVDGYKKMGATIANVGAGLTMAGVAMSGLGSKFEEAGMDVAADTFNILGSVLGGVGTAMSVVGSIMSFLTPIMSLLTTTTTAQTVASGAQSAANGVQSASWWSVMAAELGAQAAAWPLLLITLAIMVAILLLVGIIMLLVAAFKAMEAASPAGQLKAAEEAAAKAAETAEKAAESYNNLVDALENLDGKYKALEDLTRGTKEWNDAVRDINGSVVDLIQQYPELAAFAENKNGVLTIDMDSAGVQGVMKEAEMSMVSATNASLQANLEVMRKQQDVTWSEMGKGSYVQAEGPDWGKVALNTALGAGVGTLLGSGIAGVATAIAGGVAAAENSIKENSRDENEKLAKALAAGDIIDNGMGLSASDETLAELGFTQEELDNFYKQLGGSTEELKEFGKTLNEQEAQMETSYEAMATNIETLANTAGWTEEEIEAGQRLFDGDVYQKLYEDNEAAMGDLAISGSDDYENLSQENKDLMLESVKEIYGDSASITDNGKIKYKDADGNWQETAISNDEEQIRNLMIEKKTTQQAKEAAEGSKKAIGQLDDKLGNELGSKLYAADEGGALTKADIEAFRKQGIINEDGTTNKKKIEEVWNELDDDVRKAYGNSLEAFQEDFDSITIADELISEAEDALKKAKVDPAIATKLLNDTNAAFAKGVTKQTEAISESLEKQGRSGELESIMTGIADDLSGALDTVAPKLRESLQADFASVDVTNLDDLKKFQISLVDTYGLSADAAQGLIDKIAGATLATSGLVTTIEVFGDLYQASQAVESALARVAKLQWEYSQVLNESGANVKQLISDQIAAYQDAADAYANKYTATTEDLAKLRAQSMDKTKFGGKDLSGYISVNEDGSLDTSKGSTGMGLQDLLNSSSEEEREKIQDWVDNYNETWESQQEALDGMRESVDGIQELQQEGRDAFYELRDMAKNSILGAMEKQIDIQQDTLDATKETNAQIIGKIQEQIDDQRQARENAKMEEDLNNLYAQQAYLAADSSGMNDLSMAQLDQQIADAEQSYEDTLIDQTIQTLSDANAKAEEQRERQIAIAEQQLVAYEQSHEFQAQVDSMMNEMMAADDQWRETELGQLIYEKYTEGLSVAEEAEWETDIGNKIGQAATWKETDWGTLTTEIRDKINTLPKDLSDAIEQGAVQKATRNQLDQITSAGLGDVLSTAGIKRNADGTYSGSGEEGAITDEDKKKIENIQTFSNANSETAKAADERYENFIKTKAYKDQVDSDSGIKLLTSEEYYTGISAGNPARGSG